LASCALVDIAVYLGAYRLASWFCLPMISPGAAGRSSHTRRLISVAPARPNANRTPEKNASGRDGGRCHVACTWWAESSTRLREIAPAPSFAPGNGNGLLGGVRVPAAGMVIANSGNPAGNRLAGVGEGYSGSEGHAEEAEQFPCFFVAIGGGDDGDVHPLGEVDGVRIDFGEDELLADAEGVVAVAVEAFGIDAAEVPDPGQGHVDESIEEFVHTPAPQSHPTADFIPGTEAEAADRFAGLGDLRSLSGNEGQMLHRLLEAFFVLEGFAYPHVDDNFFQPRQTQDILAAEFLAQGRYDLLIVKLFETRWWQSGRSGRHGSRSWYPCGFGVRAGSLSR